MPKDKRQSWLRGFQRGYYNAMGCSLSSRETGEQPSSENRQHCKETNKQPKKNRPFATESSILQRASVVEDISCEEKLLGGRETLSLSEKTNSEQNTVIRNELAKKPMGLTERERQRSADILEELRTQGIIKTASGTSQNRQGDETMLIATGRPPSQRPPAKLEKLEIKREKDNSLTVKDSESKTRVEPLKQELLTDRPSPTMDDESRTIGRKTDNSTPEVQKASRPFQRLSLNLSTRSLMQKEEEDECYSFEDFDVVESDVNYNTTNETF